MKKKKLTRKKALQICRELWKWLEKTGGGIKNAWPEWGKYGFMSNCCPCCQYAHYATNVGCGGCPLKTLWPKGCISTKRSPYDIWDRSRTGTTRSKYAKQIRLACDRELRKYKTRRKQ